MPGVANSRVAGWRIKEAMPSPLRQLVTFLSGGRISPVPKGYLVKSLVGPHRSRPGTPRRICTISATPAALRAISRSAGRFSASP